MPSNPHEENQDSHDIASGEVMKTLQTLLNDGVIPGGGMVSSYIAIVENIDNDGHSRCQVLWSDNRNTTLLGLLSYGQILIHSGVVTQDIRPPEDR